MGKLFGTDGVRGIANKELTSELAYNLGRAGAYVLSKEKKKEKPLIIIGLDTRISGDMLENAISAGILSVGGNVIKVGVLPTPAVAYLVKKYKADAGVVISASHNSFEFNGIKFFNGQGYKLADSIEEEIEDIILNNKLLNLDVVGGKIGCLKEADENALDAYKNHLLETMDLNLSGQKIVLDCANGAAYKVAEQVYKELGANVVTIGNAPNGVNINDGFGSTAPEALMETVIREGAFLGLAFDGDADRLIAVDENGEIIDGDRVICICASMLQNENRLTKGIVTTTVMSNIGMHNYVKSIGGTSRVTDVGDRYVLADMLKTGSAIGGEQSGHIIFSQYSTTGDGILSSLQLVRAVLKTGKNASELANEIIIYPQVLKNAKVLNSNKKIYMEDEEIQNIISEMEKTLGDTGRVLVRASGTEPLVRVMLEGENYELLDELADVLVKIISNKFGN